MTKYRLRFVCPHTHTCRTDLDYGFQRVVICDYFELVTWEQIVPTVENYYHYQWKTIIIKVILMSVGRDYLMD